jgi:hypothetical protein
MCRNITMLRGLQPPATAEEIEAAARQYVRKVGGVQTVSATTEAAFERAVEAVAEATTALLADAAAAAPDQGQDRRRRRSRRRLTGPAHTPAGSASVEEGLRRIEGVGFEDPPPVADGADRVTAEQAPQADEQGVAAPFALVAQPGASGQLTAADDTVMGVDQDPEHGQLVGRQGRRRILHGGVVRRWHAARPYGWHVSRPFDRCERSVTSSRPRGRSAPGSTNP